MGSYAPVELLFLLLIKAIWRPQNKILDMSPTYTMKFDEYVALTDRYLPVTPNRLFSKIFFITQSLTEVTY